MTGHLPFSTSALTRLARGLAGLFAAGPRPEARRPARLGVESLEERLALSLTPIAANAGYPYTTIVEIQATFPDHKTYVGTGVMVDRFHVLTAGHMTYSSADGGFASRVAVTPELNGYSQPFGTAYMTYERTYNAFVNYDRAHPHNTAPGDYDIGLLTLDRTIGDRTGWMSFGYDNNNADFSAGHILNTAGYPAAGGYDGRHLEYSGGTIAGLSAGGSALQYYQSAITTYGGQSGSPVWRYNPSTGSRVVYGVHVGGSGSANSLNFATRITQGIFNDLNAWRNADALPGSAYAARSLAIGPAQSGLFGRSGTAQAGVASDSPAHARDLVWTAGLSGPLPAGASRLGVSDDEGPHGRGPAPVFQDLAAGLLDAARQAGHGLDAPGLAGRETAQGHRALDLLLEGVLADDRFVLA
jgi:V8-like Glu-specific endopeptidase